MAERRTEIAPREEHRLAQRQSGPFGLLERFADEMDRMFEEFGFGRSSSRAPLAAGITWAPQVEVSQRNNELVVRADLPGLTKDDVKVDITENALTIQGERRREHEEEQAGIYRSERSYGSFYRVIRLPEGAMADQAKATFKDGVLEITMPAPPEQVTRGRRLEISDARSENKTTK